LERGSTSRVYTHAYLAEGHCPIRPDIASDTGRWQQSGFSSSEQQARKNMEAETAWIRGREGYSRDFAEVVAVEVIEKRTREAAHG